ncbi:phage tail tube protein [uncultured Sulfitobacter sp.]|uniref:phage tail tube protein n=1 Tax=uncultured Sulfitobacter sp. TaxID=191468 RepID=UPI002605B832|nr:phage tail tube protein [uncultured Sulfitobacter sp.]
MSNARGDEAQLLSRIQTGFGAAEGAGDGQFYALPFYSCNTSPSQELNEDEAIYGDAFPGDAVGGLQNLSGNMVVPMGLNSIGWHLRSILGVPVTTELSAGKYQHVFTAAALPTLQYMTQCVSHKRVDQHFVQDSLVATSFEVQARKNSERGRATMNMIGRAEVPVADTLDATPLTYAVDPVPVGFAGKCLVGTQETAAITGVSLTLNSGSEADQESLNGLATAAAIDWGRWSVTGSLDARFRDRTWYDRALSGTAIDLAITWAVGADYSLELRSPSVRIERTGIPIEGRGIISSSFNLRGNRPAAGASLFTATLRNTVENYANPV